MKKYSDDLEASLCAHVSSSARRAVIQRGLILFVLLQAGVSPKVFAQHKLGAPAPTATPPNADDPLTGDLSRLPHPAWIRLLAARLWPADDYTRLTLEFSDQVNFRYRAFPQQAQLIVEVDEVLPSATLNSLPRSVKAEDPYLRGIRIVTVNERTTRLILELKQNIVPQVFAAPPVGQYRHRFFMDLYPLPENDPLLALLALQDEEPPIPTPTPTPAPQSPSNQSKAPTKTVDKPSAPIIMKQTRFMVVLDPGHGGEDPGAIGPEGTYEKTVVLEIAKRVQKRLIGLGINAVLTRERDFFIPLSQRVAKARKLRADVFVSIHADAFVRREASGSSIYVVSDKGVSSTAARWLADKENNADKIGGILSHPDSSVANTLLDLAQTRTRQEGQRMATLLLNELAEVNKLHKRLVEYAEFAVLKAPDIPSTLIETAFISNPIEERRLRQSDYQESLAMAIARGLHFYRTSA